MWPRMTETVTRDKADKEPGSWATPNKQKSELLLLVPSEPYASRIKKLRLEAFMEMTLIPESSKLPQGTARADGSGEAEA